MQYTNENHADLNFQFKVCLLCNNNVFEKGVGVGEIKLSYFVKVTITRVQMVKLGHEMRWMCRSSVELDCTTSSWVTREVFCDVMLRFISNLNLVMFVFSRLFN